MRVSLTPQLRELVRQKVESGLYDNESEVIREALRLMLAQDELHRVKLERLREALVAGEQSGFADDFSLERLMAQLDEESKAEAAADG